MINCSLVWTLLRQCRPRPSFNGSSVAISSRKAQGTTLLNRLLCVVNKKLSKPVTEQLCLCAPRHFWGVVRCPEACLVHNYLYQNGNFSLCDAKCMGIFCVGCNLLSFKYDLELITILPCLNGTRSNPYPSQRWNILEQFI